MPIFLFCIQLHKTCEFVCCYLQPHELQHARPPCPSPTPGDDSNWRPSSQWCHPAISSSVVPFYSCPQSLPAFTRPFWYFSNSIWIDPRVDSLLSEFIFLANSVTIRFLPHLTPLVSLFSFHGHLIPLHQEFQSSGNVSLMCWKG